MAAKKKCISCDDCYFGKNMLCALNLGKPCPTFRPADRGLRPERQHRGSQIVGDTGQPAVLETVHGRPRAVTEPDR